MITSVNVSPWSCAFLSAACQRSSSTRIVWFGVFGWFDTYDTMDTGANAPGQRDANVR